MFGIHRRTDCPGAGHGSCRAYLPATEWRYLAGEQPRYAWLVTSLLANCLKKNQSNLCMYGVDGFGQFVDLVALMFGDGFLPLSNSCRRLRDSFGKALTVLNVHHAGFIWSWTAGGAGGLRALLGGSSSKAEQRISTLVSDAASCPRDFPCLLEQLRHLVST